MKKIHIIPTDKPSKLWLTWLTWLSKLWFVKNPICEEFKVEWHTTSINKRVYKIIIPSKEPKQETLEEAAESFLNSKKWMNDGVNNWVQYTFKEGAKWMQERMLSEALEFAEWCDNMGYTQVNSFWKSINDKKEKTTKKLFEEFKKQANEKQA